MRAFNAAQSLHESPQALAEVDKIDRTGNNDRIGGGHPEGLFESWSNLYCKFAMAMDAMDRGQDGRLAGIRYPDIEAGVAGVRWIENCVRSADQGGIWVEYR